MTLAARLVQLERRLTPAGCRTCAERPVIVLGPDPESGTCPECGAEFERRVFTIRIERRTW